MPDTVICPACRAVPDVWRKAWPDRLQCGRCARSYDREALTRPMPAPQRQRIRIEDTGLHFGPDHQSEGR